MATVAFELWQIMWEGMQRETDNDNDPVVKGLTVW